MSDDGRPGQQAKEHFKQGFSQLWKAARNAAGKVKEEATNVKDDITTTNVVRALDDAGKELARAAGSVADRIGSEINDLSGVKKHSPQEGAPQAGAPRQEGSPPVGGSTDARRPVPPPRASAPGAVDPTSWPKTAEDYQKKYGAVDEGTDWPRTQDEYERRYGPLAKSPASKPSGVRIAPPEDE